MLLFRFYDQMKAGKIIFCCVLKWNAAILLREMVYNLRKREMEKQINSKTAKHFIHRFLLSFLLSIYIVINSGSLTKSLK